jgi:putative phage-type endonuclease
MALTEKQKQAREGSLGSSDAPVVVGLSPYKSPLVLYYQLRGELPRYSEDETQAQRIGSKLEPVIAEIAAEELQLKIRRVAPRRHPTLTFMSANLDFEIVGHPKGAGVLEIKNRSGVRPWEELPQDIELQTRHQMAVTNRQWGLVAVLFQFGTLRTYEVGRDKDLEDALIELERRFMEGVTQGHPPTVEWDAQSVKILRKLYPRDSGLTVTLDTMRALYACRGLIGLKEQQKALDDAEARCKGVLQADIGEASRAIIPQFGEVTCRNTNPIRMF